MATDPLTSYPKRTDKPHPSAQRPADAAADPGATIRQAQESDVPAIAQVHALTFPQSFYTALGPHS